jgi:hypothetical protein
MITFKQFLLNEIRIPIEDILPDKDNMEVAVDSLRKGMISDDKSPLKLYKSEKHENKYVLDDGHHRLLKAIIDGEDSINCKIDPTPMSDSGTIELDPMADGNYYGLDQTLENGWLINRL